MNNLKKRCLTLLLSLAMIVTYMPTSLIAYAEAEGETDQVQVEQQVDAEEPAAEVTSEDAAPEEVKTEDVKSEEAASEEKAKDAASPEKESSEEAGKPSDDGKGDEKAEAEKSGSKAEDKDPLVFYKDLDTVAVKVTVPADAFSEKVELVVKQLDKTNNEDKEFKIVIDN